MIQSSLGNGHEPAPDSFIFAMINRHFTSGCRPDSYIFLLLLNGHVTHTREDIIHLPCEISESDTLTPKGCPRV